MSEKKDLILFKIQHWWIYSARKPLINTEVRQKNAKNIIKIFVAKYLEENSWNTNI